MLPFRRAACVLLTFCLSATRTEALAFPLTLKHAAFDSFDASARDTSLTELAILFTFAMAIIWLVVGAYVLSAITEARAFSVLRSLRRNPMSRFHTFSPLAAIGGTGRAGLVPHRTPARRGGLSYPMTASRTRWHLRRSRALLPI